MIIFPKGNWASISRKDIYISIQNLLALAALLSTDTDPSPEAQAQLLQQQKRIALKSSCLIQVIHIISPTYLCAGSN
jgi:hypothetical protein